MSVDIQQIRAYIEQHFARIAGPDEIAEAFDVPVETLRRSFRRKVGVTPADYLRRVRIGRAKRLLAETELRVSEVCRDVRWERADSGARAFQREVGCSMRAYRQRSQDGKS